MGMLLCFSAIFTKGGNYLTSSLLLRVPTKLFKKALSTLLGKNGANSFLEKLAPFEDKGIK